MKTIEARFGDLPNETMFIYNGVVYEKLRKGVALNGHTLKNETFDASTLVEVLPE